MVGNRVCLSSVVLLRFYDSEVGRSHLAGVASSFDHHQRVAVKVRADVDSGRREERLFGMERLKFGSLAMLFAGAMFGSLASVQLGCHFVASISEFGLVLAVWKLLPLRSEV